MGQINQSVVMCLCMIGAQQIRARSVESRGVARVRVTYVTYFFKFLDPPTFERKKLDFVFLLVSSAVASSTQRTMTD